MPLPITHTPKPALDLVLERTIDIILTFEPHGAGTTYKALVVYKDETGHKALGRWDEAGALLADVAQTLARAGADFLVHRALCRCHPPAWAGQRVTDVPAA